jgi:hypothetical protein
VRGWSVRRARNGSFFESAEAFQRQRPVAMNDCGAKFESRRPILRLQRFHKLALIGERNAQMAVVNRRVWDRFECSPKRPFRRFSRPSRDKAMPRLSK